MAKIRYNVKGVDRGRGDFEQPKPGLYEMVVVEANHRDAGEQNDIELIIEVTEANAEFVGSRVWTYIHLGEASQWKLAELVDALKLPEQGELDPKKLVGKKMKVKINPDSWEGQYRARAGRFIPLDADAEEAAPGEDPDAGAPDAAGAAEPEGTVDINDVELSTDPEYYNEWTDDDVMEEVTNQSLTFGKGKKKTRAAVIAALCELARETLAQGGDAAAEATTDGDNYDDEDAWSDADIAAEVKRRELEVKGKRNRTTFIAALREDDAKDAAETDDPFAG